MIRYIEYYRYMVRYNIVRYDKICWVLYGGLGWAMNILYYTIMIEGNHNMVLYSK